MTRDEQRARARELTARNYTEHQRKQGKEVSYESVKREINERADKLDKKADWNEKG